MLRLTRRKQMRNLGHDMVGGKVIRTVAKGRLGKLQKRIGCVKVLQATAGSKVGAIWRSGLLAGAAHGSSVSGVPGCGVKQLRQTAGVIAGVHAKG
eukprot:9480863-Pyramimonas_sp.AAC.1